jgi:hypothetical protein
MGWIDFSEVDLSLVPITTTACITDSDILTIDADSPVANPYETTIRWASPNNQDSDPNNDTIFQSCSATGDWSGSLVEPNPTPSGRTDRSGVSVPNDPSTFGIECEEQNTGQLYCADDRVIYQTVITPTLNLTGPGCVPDTTVTPNISWSWTGQSGTCTASWVGGNPVPDSGSVTVTVDPSGSLYEVACTDSSGSTQTALHRIDVSPSCVYNPQVIPIFEEV